MSKYSRLGGKYGGTHTTLIPAAAVVCDIANACPSVRRIFLGFIKAGLRSVSGHRRVKITEQREMILLSIRDNTSHQEVHIYADDVQAAKQAIASGARGKNIRVSFAREDP